MHAAIERNSWRLPADEVVVISKSKKNRIGNEEELTSYVGLSDAQYWRSVALSLVVIALIIGGITCAICWYGFVDELQYWSGRKITLQELVDGDLTPVRLPSNWVTKDHFCFQSDDGSLSVLDTSTNLVSVLISNYTLMRLNVQDYKCSFNIKFILLTHHPKQVFKNVFKSHYTVYDITLDYQINLRINSTPPDVEHADLEYANWLGNTTSIVMIEKGDIYLRKFPTDTYDSRITYSAIKGVISNGVPDWLYQEDIFKNSEYPIWPCADGSRLLYAEFNDSRVNTFNFPSMEMFAISQSSNCNSNSFPPTTTIRYPINGTPIPSVKLWIVNVNETLLNDNNTSGNYLHINRTEVIPPISIGKKEHYLISARWDESNNGAITVVWMNRPQTRVVISKCQSPSWNCTKVYTDRAAEKMYLEKSSHPLFGVEGKFLMLTPVQENGIRFFTQIKKITPDDQKISIVTHGPNEIEEILAWDSHTHLVYYLARGEKNSEEQHLFVVRDKYANNSMIPDPICVSCRFVKTLKMYENCTHFSAYFNPAYGNTFSTHYILQCNGPYLPFASLHRVLDHEFVKGLFQLANQHSSRINEIALPKKMYLEVPLFGGYSAKVELSLPPSWRKELRDAAFPVIVEANENVNVKFASSKWNVDWGSYMSSKRGCVRVKMDVRYSKGKMVQDFSKSVAAIQVEDIQTVVRHLLQEYDFMDENRVAIWGRGYGGYLTTILLSSHRKIFKCGIAIAPIVNWAYINSAFADKIFSCADENTRDEYIKSDARNGVAHIADNSLFLLHGLSDTSVPYAHSLWLSKALIDAGVIYRYQVYPDEDHDLRNSLKHVYNSMEDYFNRCLNLDENDNREV